MSHINEKLGLRPAGQRTMMKLPKRLADRNRITAAQCPACERRGQIPLPRKGPAWLFCPGCNTTWELPA